MWTGVGAEKTISYVLKCKYGSIVSVVSKQNPMSKNWHKARSTTVIFLQ